MVKKSKVKVVPPVDPKVLEEVLKVVSQVVEPEPEPEPEPEHECACYSPEECSGDCPAIEESGGPNFIYEPEPEPVAEQPASLEPEPKPLRPCERVLGPEEIERRRLDTEKRRANKLKNRR